VAECQNRCVKGLPGCRSLEVLGVAPERSGDPPAAAPGVDRIADDWMSDVLQMHSNLMGAATVQVQTEKIGHCESSDHTGVRASRPSGRDHGHPFPILRVPRQRRVDDRATLVQMTPGERRISSMNPASGDGRAEPSVSQIGFRDDHEA
jgi:hypothetical protein